MPCSWSRQQEIAPLSLPGDIFQTSCPSKFALQRRQDDFVQRSKEGGKGPESDAKWGMQESEQQDNTTGISLWLDDTAICLAYNQSKNEQRGRRLQMKSNDTLKRTGCLRRLITAVVIISALLAIFLIGLQINQQIGLAKFYRENPPPGRLFTINGHAMHLHCLGNGTPTVIIDAGNSSYSVEWRPLQERLSTNLRVCTFDRPGYGWSESSSAVRDGEQVVRELHELLQTAGEMGPYILVGHSLGGVHVRLYAAAYPQETAGLVLVDTAMPLLVTPEFEQQMASSIGFYRVVQILSGSGLMRLIGPLGGEDAMPANAKKLPAGIQEIYLQMALDARQYTTAIAEMTVLAKTFEQTQASLVGEQPFGDLPVIVLTAGLTFADGATPFDERLAMVEPAQIERQAALARLSKRGEQRLIAKSGHAMHLDAPEAIIQAALDLVASLR